MYYNDPDGRRGGAKNLEGLMMSSDVIGFVYLHVM